MTDRLLAPSPPLCLRISFLQVDNLFAATLRGRGGWKAIGVVYHNQGVSPRLYAFATARRGSPDPAALRPKVSNVGANRGEETFGHTYVRCRETRAQPENADVPRGLPALCRPVILSAAELNALR